MDLSKRVGALEKRFGLTAEQEFIAFRKTMGNKPLHEWTDAELLRARDMRRKANPNPTQDLEAMTVDQLLALKRAPQNGRWVCKRTSPMCHAPACEICSDGHFIRKKQRR